MWLFIRYTAILLTRLEHCVGIKGAALEWFRSYLSNRKFSVNIGEYSSEAAVLSCGVPQGSIVAPILFPLYMLSLGSIFRKYGLSFHCYAEKLSGRKKCGTKRCTTNRENRSLMRIVKQNRFKNLCELHKEWTEAGVKASRAPHTDVYIYSLLFRREQVLYFIWKPRS